MQTTSLPQDYALVLQQLHENGEEDLDILLESLYVERRRLRHVIAALHHRGLIQFRRTSYDTWVRLSSKGRHFMATLWPESQAGFA